MLNLEIILVVLFVLITFIGVLKRNRVLFNLGYFLYGLSVFVVELQMYNDILSFSHLLFAILFLLQAILSIPNKLPYDGGKLAKSAAVKIYSCLSIINLVGILVPYTSPAPNITFYLHLVMAIFPMIAVVMILTNKIPLSSE